MSDGEKNYFYFIINIIIAFIISFFGCVFNEFLVLSFCGLDHETHFSVSIRAENAKELKLLLDDESDSINE